MDNNNIDMDFQVASSINQIMNGDLPRIQDPVVCELNIPIYIDKYDGFTKLQRLSFIAEKSSNLQKEAYHTLFNEIKRGSNTSLYVKLYSNLGNMLGIQYDQNWVESTEKREAVKLEKLEAELMAAKTTMVKESIRLCYSDIGDLHYESGNLSEAMKSYLRTRDYCTIPRHNYEMCIRVVSVSMDLAQYGNVTLHISKAESNSVDALTAAKLKAASALVMLIEGQYKGAAKKFLEVGIELGSTFSSVIAPEDVATYGTLCALATLDRSEIKKSLLENSAFKSYLELTPEVKSLIENFFTGKYGDCLVYLDTIKSTLLIDMHLSKHVHPLIAMIKERVVLQYFSPYSSVDMNRMASSLNMSLVDLEKAVASLITRDKMSARIDSQAKTLHKRQNDVRSMTIDKVMQLSDNHVREIKRGILRLSVIQHGFHVQSRDINVSKDSNNLSSNNSRNSSSASMNNSSYNNTRSSNIGVEMGSNRNSNKNDNNNYNNSNNMNNNSNNMNNNNSNNNSNNMRDVHTVGDNNNYNNHSSNNNNNAHNNNDGRMQMEMDETYMDRISNDDEEDDEIDTP